MQLALTPASTPAGSEAAFAALTSFTLKLGPVLIAVEQIGFTVNVGSSSDGSPPDASSSSRRSSTSARSASSSRPGSGSASQSDFVNGGGFLFYDKDNEEYAGVLQLDFGPRYTFTAIGCCRRSCRTGARATRS